MVISAFHGTDCCIDSFRKITGTLFLTDNPGLAKMFGENVFRISVTAEKVFEVDWDGCSWGGGFSLTTMNCLTALSNTHHTAAQKSVNIGKITACALTCLLPSCLIKGLMCSLFITSLKKTASVRQNMLYQEHVR